MEQQEDWKVVHKLDDWELTIIVPEDYSLLTDFELKSPNSTRYLGTIGTPEMLREIINKPGEATPLWISDLILVDQLTEDTLVAAVSVLIDREEVERALDRVAPDLEPLIPGSPNEKEADRG